MPKGFEVAGTDQLLQVIYEAILRKKGMQIIDIDLTLLNTSICNHYVICHAGSSTQVRAIADAVEDDVTELLHVRSLHKEGMEMANWVLIDFPEVMVHIFQEQHRRFYDLEGLWADGRVIEINDFQQRS